MVAQSSSKMSWLSIIKQVFHDWSDDNAQRLGAALAYYAGFSIAPLLLIALAIAGLVFEHEQAARAIHDQLRDLLGGEAASGVEGLIAAAAKPSEGILATVIGVVVLLMGASGVFGELQCSLNAIWHVAPKPGRGLLGTIRDRFLSFTMVLGAGFLLLVSLVISAVLSAIGHWMAQALPGPAWLIQVMHIVVSFVITALLFAMIFKVLPDVEIRWKDVWIGAIVTTVLFSIGKFAIGLYLGHSAVASSFGAAGSFVVLLIWVYYSAQILFFGAEFTKVYAQTYGSGAKQAADAVPNDCAKPRQR
jgi:membrane protein